MYIHRIVRASHTPHQPINNRGYIHFIHISPYAIRKECSSTHEQKIPRTQDYQAPHLLLYKSPDGFHGAEPDSSRRTSHYRRIAPRRNPTYTEAEP